MTSFCVTGDWRYPEFDEITVIHYITPDGQPFTNLTENIIIISMTLFSQTLNIYKSSLLCSTSVTMIKGKSMRQSVQRSIVQSAGSPAAAADKMIPSLA